ncbi:hypothetical protein JW948_16240 [bacterium]|nr:hypothetical protein [bacterium]
MHDLRADLLKKGLMLLLVFWGCDSYNPMSPGPQPEVMEPAAFQDMLNVFGVLRPDSLHTLPLSFVHVEFAVPYGDDLDSTRVTDAEVLITPVEDKDATGSITLTYTDFDVFETAEYRHRSLFPVSGTYRLRCSRPGFPVLEAETVMPGKPVIRDDRIVRSGRSISFALERDDHAGLAEAVIEGGSWTVRSRFIRPETGDIQIALTLPDESTESCLLTVFVFDLNLSAYLTANLSIKPNIYQADFSTVENGTGCFGSMNVLKRTIR